ncbi:MAG: DUF2085 domain-containing protein [Anaerolineaceae bacterium]|nr:DUF2085 domain-containing protein [Anaerolineaceae bacterium]
MKRPYKKGDFSLIFLPLLFSAIFFLVCLVLHVSPSKLIGAAFCHQIPSRSPAYDFPFCYRCSGLFFGIFFGSIAGVFSQKNKQFLSKIEILLLFLSLILFFADILNSSKIPDIYFYKESVIGRMISSFPLGFTLSGTVFHILDYLNLIHRSKKGLHPLAAFLVFITGGLISYFFIFTQNLFLSICSRIMLSTGAAAFLSCLYGILIYGIKTLQNQNISIYSIAEKGISAALLHITLFGFLHLRFINFAQFLS